MNLKILDKQIKENEGEYDLDRDQLKYLNYQLVSQKNMNI